MSDYFSSYTSIPSSTAALLVPSAAVDRLVLVSGGGFSVGFSATTAVLPVVPNVSSTTTSGLCTTVNLALQPLPTSVPLPAGEELWGYSTTGTVPAYVIVTVL